MKDLYLCTAYFCNGGVFWWEWKTAHVGVADICVQASSSWGGVHLQGSKGPSMSSTLLPRTTMRPADPSHSAAPPRSSSASMTSTTTNPSFRRWLNFGKQLQKDYSCYTSDCFLSVRTTVRTPWFKKTSRQAHRSCASRPTTLTWAWMDRSSMASCTGTASHLALTLILTQVTNGNSE